MSDRPVRAFLVVVSALSFQLFLRIGKRQEPVGVQALRPHAPTPPDLAPLYAPALM